MRFSDLSPKWIGVSRESCSEQGLGCFYGVSFLCPHCLKQKLAVNFKPFIDPSDLYNRHMWAFPRYAIKGLGAENEVLWWTRVSGESFDTLTLSPSIDTSKLGYYLEFQGHWHGFIQNGEIT